MTLVVLTAVTMVTLSLLAVTARQVRATYLRWDLQQAVLRADATGVAALSHWMPARIAAAPIGVLRDTMERGADGWVTRQRIMRTGPLIAVVDVSAEHQRGPGDTNTPDAEDPWAVRRRVARVVWLQPPALPLPATVTVLGDLTLTGAAIDGRDQPANYPEAADDCGSRRDTASRVAIAARAVTGTSAAVQGDVRTLAPTLVAQGWTDLQTAKPQLVERLHTIPSAVSGHLARGAQWQGQQLGAEGMVTTLAEEAEVQGLLVVDGDLVLTGTLHLDGLLVVIGRLDATAGRLLLHGQLLVADPAGREVRLGPGTAVRYAPCLVGRALAAVALPRPDPFFSWNTP